MSRCYDCGREVDEVHDDGNGYLVCADCLAVIVSQPTESDDSA